MELRESLVVNIYFFQLRLYSCSFITLRSDILNASQGLISIAFLKLKILLNFLDFRFYVPLKILQQFFCIISCKLSWLINFRRIKLGAWRRLLLWKVLLKFLRILSENNVEQTMLMRILYSRRLQLFLNLLPQLIEFGKHRLLF